MKKPIIDKKYLPSKQFAFAIGSGVFVVLVIVLIAVLTGQNSTFSRKNKGKLTVGSPTVIELVEKDTDEDGVFDWEEALWGTNKNRKSTFDGIPDKQYIENQRQALELESSENDKALNETDKFAREFFTAYAALKSAGEDQESIEDFSRALGEEIANATIIDQYTENDINTAIASDKAAVTEYYNQVQSLFAEYQAKGIGDEINIVNSGLLTYTQEGTSSDNRQLEGIGLAYQDFAKALIETRVPAKYTGLHLEMANGANNLGLSVKDMMKIVDDPLVGLTGITQYQTYSDAFIETVQDLESTLLKEIEA